MHITFFNDLLSKEMTRKEFLVHVGLLVCALTGISSILKTLSDPHLASTASFKSKPGFGHGPYGG